MSKFLYLLVFLFIISSCQNIRNDGKIHIKNKTYPEYDGIQPEFQEYVNKYKILAKENGIYFSKIVTVGQKKLPSNKIIGLCNYGRRFREIDIDSDFWKHTSPEVREILIFHELTHCYCTRDHDWDKDKLYNSEDTEISALEVFNFVLQKQQPGFYKDDCPLSIMYPVILDKYCIKVHYEEYLKEMFQRCDPF